MIRVSSMRVSRARGTARVAQGSLHLAVEVAKLLLRLSRVACGFTGS
jgi:hypothetical protein